MQEATLRLFNAIQVDKNTVVFYDPPIDPGMFLTKRTIKNGYILDPFIQPHGDLLDTIESVVGISGEKANSAFHKSWKVIREASIEQLVIQQIVHYITTYGFEAGIYRGDTVYIPHEKLEIPAVTQNIPLVVIKAMSKEELLDSIVKLGSGIALSQETLNDIMTIVKANNYDSDFVKNIGNRELKTLLSNFYGLVPSEPVEYLRYLVNKLTGESLLIKNDYLINKIKLSGEHQLLESLIKKAPENLASVFHRFKPIFLALKSISRNKTFFNQLRKKARRLHIPMPEDRLGSVTSNIKHGNIIALDSALDRANIFRKIRLAYALNYRLNPCTSIVYKVRNGKGWADDFEWSVNLKEPTGSVLNRVLESIIKDIRPNVEGKTILIPPYIYYTLPATEKQFTGHFPTGSSVSVPNDMIVGIHWTNTDRRIDLDLSVIGESGKIGWDSSYRSGNRDVLFSGDLTDAPKPDGASELFYLESGQKEAKILMLNFYNFANDEVPAKILVAHEKIRDFDKDYMVDPNNIVATANVNINKKQNILGIICNYAGENRVYFASVSIGNSITSSRNGQSTHARRYFVSSLVNSIDLREILILAGAKVVDEKPEEGEYLDLSPEALDKTTIIDLINPTQ